MAGIHPFFGFRPADERSSEGVCQLPAQNKNGRSIAGPPFGRVGPLGLSGASRWIVANCQTNRHVDLR